MPRTATQENTSEISGTSKAAILLIALGPEKSAKVFKHLKEEEIEQLTLEIANTRSVSPQMKEDVLNEFYQVAFRRRLYQSLEELQADLDTWIDSYNTQRTHQGKMCCGRTPMQTLIEGKSLWAEKVGQLN